MSYTCDIQRTRPGQKKEVVWPPQYFITFCVQSYTIRMVYLLYRMYIDKRDAHLQAM